MNSNPMQAGRTILVSLSMLAATAFAQGGPVDPAALTWKTLPNGVSIAVFMGDPTRPGPYASRAKLPPNLRIPPHTHPEDGRTTTVIAGTLYWAFGETFDAAKLRAFGPGSVIVEPRGVAHFAMAGEEGAELQTNSTGPAGMTFLEPAK
ncbi:MAG TPA: cupin domain-containing protein [Burkholderiales bacterium]|nr:cupin domain-containing protein [Burkholderiales bacterium]